MTRVGRPIAMACLGLALCLSLATGTASAATFFPTLEGSFPIQATPGENIAGAFGVKIVATGNFPTTQSGSLIVCNAVSLNADGTSTCTNTVSIGIQHGNPPPNFPQEIQVSLSVSNAVPCDHLYSVSVPLELDVTGGADFGKDDNDKDIRSVDLQADVQVNCVGGTEGCSLGFWKNHVTMWQGVFPDDKVDSVFLGASSSPYNLGDVSLFEALSFKGGSTLQGAAQILLRQAVAAILNAAHGGVGYPRTVAEITDDVDNALSSQTRATILGLAAALDGDNNLGCPLP